MNRSAEEVNDERVTSKPVAVVTGLANEKAKACPDRGGEDGAGEADVEADEVAGSERERAREHGGVELDQEDRAHGRVEELDGPK